MRRIALLAATSLLLATAAPTALAGPAEGAQPKPRPKLTATGGSVAESAGKAVVTLKLARPARKAVKVTWRTVDGTAKAGSDYAAGTGTTKIKRGKKSATVSVKVLGDTVHEQTETFTVRLASKQAKVPAKPVTVTITDDDQAAPTGPPTPPTPTAPSALTGTVTVTRSSFLITSSSSILTMNLRLVPTTTPGEWRDDGTGTWNLVGSATGFPGICIPSSSTSILGNGVFLKTAGEAATGQAALALSGFDPVAATGSPSLSYAGKSLATQTTGVPGPTPPLCDSVVSTIDYPFTLAEPGAIGTYTGTSGVTRGVSFAYNGPVGLEALSVTGTLTPVS